MVSSYPEQTESVKLANEKLSLLLRAEAPAKSTEITIRRVWSGPDVMDVQSPSPDGRYLSYTDWETRDLTVHDLVTGQNRHITKNTTGNKPGDRYDFPDNSVFSPDGNRIAYCWWIENEDIEDKDFYGEIRTIAPDGSGERVIYRSKENFPSRLDWSTDGKQILTKLNERPALIAVADGSIQYLPIESPGMMCFAPNGSYIAFDARPSKDARQSDVYVYDRTTQRTSLLVRHPANDGLAGWSPDGRYVLFASDRRGSLDAWLIAVSDGQPQGEPILVRSNLGERSEAIGFTRSGAFFFSGGTGGRDVFSAKLDIQKGKLLSNPEEAAGSNLGSNWGPDFSRDGKSLAYVTGQGGIAIQSLETTDKKTIKPDYEIRRAGRMYGLRWAPDGRSFVTTGVDRQGRKGLIRIDSFNGQTTLLFESDSAMMPPFDLSPDGKKIYYISDPLGSLLFVWDSESGQKRQLGDKKIWSLAVSPDGGQLAFFGSGGQAEPSGLFVIPSTGGSPKLMVESKDRRGAVAWSPDGTQLLYAVSSKSSDNGTPATLRYELWRVSSQGGEPQRFGLTVDGMMMSLRIHPDGQRIAYGTLWSSPEIWVMENFLPKEKIEDNNQLTLKKLEHGVLNTPSASLSPDGRYISYPDWNTGDLAIHDMVTGKDRRLTNKGSWAVSNDNAGYSLFSPDGKQVAYTWRIWAKNQTELRIIKYRWLSTKSNL